MTLVLTFVPKKQFDVPGVIIPKGLGLQFETILSEDAVIAACRNKDFLLVGANYPIVSAKILENIPSIRMVQSHGTGYDKIDIDAAARLSIPVANSPGQNAMTVAEFTLSLIIALQRRMIVLDREIKAGNYSEIRKSSISSGLNEIRDCRIGFVGLGTIGKLVAKIAGLLGARMAYHDVYRADKDLEMELRLDYKSLDKLLASSDIVCLHVPLTEQTKKIIGKRELELMPQGSLLINTSRGEVVDQAALADALGSGHIGGAAIDTVSPEPPPPDHPLLNLSLAARDRLILTPHIAGVTDPAFVRLTNSALANIERVAAGKPPENVVNGIKEARERAERIVHRA
jgi:phosphoglycerate dehydrogenase-like enzyme